MANSKKMTGKYRIDLHFIGPCYQMEFVTDVKLLKIESVRLDTFHCWSILCPVRPEELSRQGFYFTGENDSVKCIFCKGQLNKWSAGDVVSIEHSKWFPDCPFVQGKEFDNVPMLKAHVMYPPYIMFYDRMESFNRGWHTAKNLSPDRMASAGFFQITPFDHVKCFSCGVRLNKWMPDNDPWEEHKKFTPNCAFLLERYGCYLGSSDDAMLQLAKLTNLHVSTKARTATFPQQETEYPLSQQESTPFELQNENRVNEDQLNAFAMYSCAPEPQAPSSAPEPQAPSSAPEPQASSSAPEPQASSSAPPQAKPTASKEIIENLDELGPEELKQIILEQEDERLCKICFERKLKVIFLPCNHMVCCTECGEQQRLCPICRRKIDKVQQIFFS